jgi:hypothetical protein
LRDTREVFVERLLGRASVFDDGSVVGLVEEKEIDVGAGVELAPAELPHADDDERAPLAGAGRGDAEALLAPGTRFGDGDVDADVGEVRELARRDVDVAADVRRQLARGDSELFAPGEDAEAAPNRVEVAELADGGGGEATVRASIARVLRTACDREDVARAGRDDARERGVGALQEHCEVDHLGADRLGRLAERFEKPVARGTHLGNPRDAFGEVAHPRSLRPTARGPTAGTSSRPPNRRGRARGSTA